MLSMIGRIFCLILICNIHPFHVSVCEVYHNSETQSLEITMKIFIDDLELAVRNYGEKAFNLVDIDEKHIQNEPLKKYLTAHFKISINEKPVRLEMVGSEFDGDAILCYLEAKKVRKIEGIEIDNAIITEVYADQINLTHFQYRGEMKSFQATKEQTKGIIDASNW